MLNRRHLLAAATALTLSACGRGPEDADLYEAGVIRIAILRSGWTGVQEQLWSPTLSDLQTATGLKGKIALFDSGAALVEAMSRRRIDLALVSNGPALAAVRRANAEVFARASMVAPADSAVLVVGPESRLTLDRILTCDHKLLLGVAPGGRDEALLAADAFLLAPRGVAPSHCFRDVRPAPPPTLLADLGAAKLDASIIDENQITPDGQGEKARSVRTLWRSPPIPSPSLVWRRDLDPAIKEKLRQFFLTYGHDDARERRRLAALGLEGFAPADDTHLLIEREMDAAHAWLEAKASGEKAMADRTKADLDAITAERQELEARTGAPAGAQ